MSESRPVRRPARRRGLKKWAPLFGLVFLVILVIGIPSIYTSRNSYCGSCHVMEPYSKTWAASTHAKIGCNDCHASPGALGFIAAKASLVRMTAVNIVASSSKFSPKPVPNDRCIACHAESRPITSQADLKLPRKHHAMKNNPFKCVDCHKTLVHGEEAAGMNVVLMKTCVDCHKAEKISVKCKICHYAKEE